MHRGSLIVFRRCAKVANGVDLPFAPQQNVNDNNSATLLSMSERRYFEKRSVTSEDGNGSFIGS